MNGTAVVKTSDRATAPVHGQRNLLLDALDADVHERLAPRLELTKMSRGEVLCPSGVKLLRAYFPVSGIISLMHVTENGATIESAVVGNEGLLGAAIFTGGHTMASEGTVQTEGHVYRLPAEVLLDEFNRSASTRNRLLRYTQALLAHTAQTAICSRHHTVQQQLCRKLLLSLDRMPGNELLMTHEQIARAIGVRREGISEAATALRLAGAITYWRGQITVLDRGLLEKHVCECYRVVKDECGRLENLMAPPRKHLAYSTDRRQGLRPTPPGK